jgi:nitrogen fixation/metabolism regulation signal transduction histidine kinase
LKKPKTVKRLFVAGGHMNEPGKTQSVASLTLTPGRGQGWQWRLKFENRVQATVLLAGLPAVLVALGLLWGLDFSTKMRLTLMIPVLGFWVGGSMSLRNRVCYPLRTLTNLLGALYEGDYSLKAVAARQDDVLGEVMREVNGLSDLLREQRLGARTVHSLLQKILAEIDVAVFAFDARSRLQLINHGGERLLQRNAKEVLGQEAGELGLQFFLSGSPDRIVSMGTGGLAATGGVGRWKLHRGHYREDGHPFQMVILSDLTSALHEEERQAWKRLIQILRHEINNSLTPISSIAGSMRALQRAHPRPPDWEADLSQGLEVIENRSEALHRFIRAYSEMTRLPEPRFERVNVGQWVQRVTELDPRMPVTLCGGPELTLPADRDQLDQLLINLIRNAIDATCGSGSKVEVGWRVVDGRFHLWVEDDGPGAIDTEKAFLPFYTTKPDGAGIGLPLSRQIAENHGGSLTLEAPRQGTGCRALLVLPLSHTVTPEGRIAP